MVSVQPELAGEADAVPAPATGARGRDGDSPTGEGGAGVPSARPAAGPTAEYLAGIRAAIERVLTYPPLARKRGWEGTVVASFFIDERGMPSEIRVTRGSGYGILDRETARIIERASPYPPLGGRVELPVSFRLRTP
jgi:protein TonB